jgi:hypothetical protein
MLLFFSVTQWLHIHSCPKSFKVNKCKPFPLSHEMCACFVLKLEVVPYNIVTDLSYEN